MSADSEGDVKVPSNVCSIFVVEYTYDAWGKILTKTGSLADSLGYLNPFRYRGYIYDEETGWYYCQSRYYDPVVGRWLNADGVIADVGMIQGYNVFVYCFNNSINCFDSNGYWCQDLGEEIVSWFLKIIECLFTVQYDVPLYGTGTGGQYADACWAYCQVMDESYEKKTEGEITMHYSVREADERVAELLYDAFGPDTSLWRDGAWPSNMSVNEKIYIENIIDLFGEVRNGPVYAYYANEAGAHLVIVTGVDLLQQTVTTNNPQGYSGTQTFEEFKKQYISPIYVVPFVCVYRIN